MNFKILRTIKNYSNKGLTILNSIQFSTRKPRPKSLLPVNNYGPHGYLRIQNAIPHFPHALNCAAGFRERSETLQKSRGFWAQWAFSHTSTKKRSKSTPSSMFQTYDTVAFYVAGYPATSFYCWIDVWIKFEIKE